LVTSAVCPPKNIVTQTSATSSSPSFPELLEQKNSGTHLCAQSSWLLSRIGEYFQKFFKIESSNSRPPIIQTISYVTGVPYSTVRRHISHQSVANQMPSCTKQTKQINRKKLWAKTAKKYEPFVQA
jgi:hypothetical protein